MATANQTLTTFGLTCPHCGQEEPAITLDLNNLDGQCVCGECEAEFTVKDAAEKARDQARRWSAVETWINAAGAYLGQEEDSDYLVDGQ